MTLFLASVRDEAEADIALQAGADIIDLKDPARGALGALDGDAARRIVGRVAGRVPTSATIGDLPMHSATIRAAIAERASCGVDYVKFGLFAGGDPLACLAELRPVARNVPLIVVLFADALPAFDAVGAAADMGAAGILLDTADKRSRGLTAHLDTGAIAAFIANAKRKGLTVGLAGSLTAADVPKLLALAPDLIGFRGALCHGNRNGSLDAASCAAIRALIPAETRRSARLPEATAQALC
jgi:uncharacterized protein (UPF0264 family)